MTLAKGVVHIDRRSTLGHEVENAERNAYRWRAEGYVIAPMPADDREHPYNRPCPTCTAEELDTQES